MREPAYIADFFERVGCGHFLGFEQIILGDMEILLSNFIHNMSLKDVMVNLEE